MSLLLKSLVVIGRVTLIILLLLARPLRAVLRLIFDVVLVSGYRAYLVMKVRLAALWLPAKNRVLFPLSTKYIVHAVLIVATLLVATHSLKAREIRQTDFASPDILSVLLKNNDSDEIVDSASITHPTTNRYIQGIGGISPQDIVDVSGEDVPVTSQESSSLVKTELASSTENGQVRSDVTYHIVEGGETVSDIAERYNITMNTVLWENDLTPKDYIKPGQKLTILPTSGVSHRVESGDTVSKIAQKFGASTETILVYNKLASDGAIEQGDVVLIPGGKEPPPPEQPSVSSRITGRNYASISGNPPPGLDVADGGGFLWPTPSQKINQYFSYRHIGLDIDGNYSSPLYASKSGTVVFTGWGSGYGLHVIVSHGNGISSLYGHASKIYVREGDHVKRGQTIGMMGSTGYSTGTHLHFEIRKGPGLHPQRLNPLQYL